MRVILRLLCYHKSFFTDIMGYTLDSNGAIVENADASPVDFALGFEVQGDVKGTKTWFYNCGCTRPSVEADTKETGATPKTDYS